MSHDISAFAALVRRWTPSMPAPQPADPTPDADGWVNPTPEEWAAVAARVPLVLPRRGLPFLAEHEEAEDGVLARLADLTAVHGAWDACRALFAPINERTGS